METFIEIENNYQDHLWFDTTKETEQNTEQLDEPEEICARNYGGHCLGDGKCQVHTRYVTEDGKTSVLKCNQILFDKAEFRIDAWTLIGQGEAPWRTLSWLSEIDELVVNNG